MLSEIVQACRVLKKVEEKVPKKICIDGREMGVVFAIVQISHIVQ